MIFGSDGGPRPAYFPAATITQDEYTQSETHKPHRASFKSSACRTGCRHTATGAAGGSASGADDNLTTTTRVTKKCRCHPSLPSFPFFPSLSSAPIYGPVQMRLGSDESRETLFLHRHRRSPACCHRDPARVLISCLGVYRSKILLRPLVPCLSVGGTPCSSGRMSEEELMRIKLQNAFVRFRRFVPLFTGVHGHEAQGRRRDSYLQLP
ncbi:hypothetical protein BGY98DRAFT_168740 [Russula aff. rugulosa BPL654]|nr:hypothetical protein BGY98DRAFT_168740 [Russula aff. rugulosa BPL654]